MTVLVVRIIVEDTVVDGSALCATFGEQRFPPQLSEANDDGTNALLNDSSAINKRQLSVRNGNVVILGS